MLWNLELVDSGSNDNPDEVFGARVRKCKSDLGSLAGRMLLITSPQPLLSLMLELEEISMIVPFSLHDQFQWIYVFEILLWILQVSQLLSAQASKAL
jgi:hypothetical protein